MVRGSFCTPQGPVQGLFPEPPQCESTAVGLLYLQLHFQDVAGIGLLHLTRPALRICTILTGISFVLDEVMSLYHYRQIAISLGLALSYSPLRLSTDLDKLSKIDAQ